MARLKLKKMSEEKYVGDRFSIFKKVDHWIMVDKDTELVYIENTFVDAYKRMKECYNVSASLRSAGKVEDMGNEEVFV